MKVNFRQAKVHFQRLLQRVAGGEEITVTRAGCPIAHLIPVETKRGRLRLDVDRGLFEVPEDFDAPLPAEVLAAIGQKPQKNPHPYGKRRRRLCNGAR